MKTLLDEMIDVYNPSTTQEKENVIKEIIQEIVLSGLSKADFFDKAAFYGDTALRIFYGLNRYSEDLDFSLKVPDLDFDLKSYFPMVEKEVKAFGLNMKIESKIKSSTSAIKSAFLKGNTKENLLLFYSNNSLLKGINPDAIIKVKFEIDTNPPPYATFDTKYKLSPLPYKCCLYDRSSLFAGKIAAILCRNLKNRTKGRDLYDYVFYLSKDIPFNLKHLQARLQQVGMIEKHYELTLSDIKDYLNKRFDTIDYISAKNDVIPFINNLDTINLWSTVFFKTITDSLKSQ